mmetsp:Transcript_47157/g.109029  ORF Transcript_47157/g.109029 Transcript_47157/m.109029 type:complete len:206 (+) Transcript_47157:727-1344(+)
MCGQVPVHLLYAVMHFTQPLTQWCGALRPRSLEHLLQHCQLLLRVAASGVNCREVQPLLECCEAAPHGRVQKDELTRDAHLQVHGGMLHGHPPDLFPPCAVLHLHAATSRLSVKVLAVVGTCGPAVVKDENAQPNARILITNQLCQAERHAHPHQPPTDLPTASVTLCLINARHDHLRNQRWRRWCCKHRASVLMRGAACSLRMN